MSNVGEDVRFAFVEGLNRSDFGWREAFESVYSFRIWLNCNRSDEQRISWIVRLHIRTKLSWREDGKLLIKICAAFSLRCEKSFSKLEWTVGTFHNGNCGLSIVLVPVQRRFRQTNCIVNPFVSSCFPIKLNDRNVISKLRFVVAGMNEDFRSGKLVSLNLDEVSVDKRKDAQGEKKQLKSHHSKLSRGRASAVEFNLQCGVLR